MNNQFLHSLVPDCRAATEVGIDVVVSRFEQNAGYPFVDTKLNTRTGADFPESADPESDFCGRSAVFGWIQGRGLEALAGHAAFLVDNPALVARCDGMLATVAARMAAFGEANQGRFVFLSTPDGRPFRCGADGQREYFSARTLSPGYSDLFMGKGLAAAGVRLGRPAWSELGVTTFRSAAAAITSGQFESDQISFDPKNPVRPIPGRQAQGPWMIALGGFALMCELFPGENEWVEGGVAFLRKLLGRHVIHQDSGPLRRFDFVEWTDNAGRPWQAQEQILQDPGHALEFTGLAARFLLQTMERDALSPQNRELVAASREILPEVFLAAFANGFQRPVGGICKTFDLVTRSSVNKDMPWWPLPEAMRAAALLLRLAPDHPRRAELAAAAADCARSLFGPFRSPVSGLFLQTRDSRGEPSRVIPATPDADPGYHTGLCLIDFVKTMENKGSLWR
ncbi:MAG: AGE family epimerase/isomerase [bacterium]